MEHVHTEHLLLVAALGDSIGQCCKCEGGKGQHLRDVGIARRLVEEALRQEGREAGYISDIA